MKAISENFGEKEAVEGREIPEKQINNSVERILKLKEKYCN